MAGGVRRDAPAAERGDLRPVLRPVPRRTRRAADRTGAPPAGGPGPAPDSRVAAVVVCSGDCGGSRAIADNRPSARRSQDAGDAGTTRGMYARGLPSGQHAPWIERLNTTGTSGPCAFMVIVLAHWAEHLAQAFQIYGLGWPVPEARGVLGVFFPWLITSETPALRLRAGDARRLVAAAPGLCRARRAIVVDVALGSSSSITSSTSCCRPRRLSATTSSAGPCRRASCSSGCPASNCTSSTTRSSSFRW